MDPICVLTVSHHVFSFLIWYFSLFLDEVGPRNREFKNNIFGKNIQHTLGNAMQKKVGDGLNRELFSL